MNVNPGKKQRKLHSTVIPLSNLEPAPGEDDTHGQVQAMCFPDNHPDLELRGQPKGIRFVLQERKSVWDKYTALCQERGQRVVGKCRSCSKSQTRKDAERRVALAEAAGPEYSASAEDVIVVNAVEDPTSDDINSGWCCMQRVLSLQEDFRTERPLVQTLIEDAGHICLFLPRFHCELNPIEMLWGYGKYRACTSLTCGMRCIPTDFRIPRPR